MKYALIGCGRIAVNHISAACYNNLSIVGLCDVVEENIAKLCDKCKYYDDTPHYLDYREMLEEVKPDLVSIATDSGSHADIALYCIEHGIHVIIEKPMAMSMADAEKIIKKSEEKGVKVGVCHQNRFNIAVQETKKAITEGRMGKLSHGSIHVRWNRDRDYYEQASWRGKWTSDGGALMNQCIHGIDLLCWMFGYEVEEVYGTIRRQFHNYIETEDIGMAILKFKNGAIGTVEGTVNVYPRNLEETLYVFGEKGTVKFGGKTANTIDVWDFAESKEDDIELKGLCEKAGNIYGNGHIHVFKDFIHAIVENRSPYIDAWAGRNALEIVLAIYKSAKEGRPIRLPLGAFTSADMKEHFKDLTVM